MNIVRWEPLLEPVRLRNAMGRLFEDSFFRPLRFPVVSGTGVYMPVDTYQTDNELVIKAALPGVKPEEVDISITADTVTIKGEVKAEEEVKQENYLFRERSFGSFSRSITIPDSLQSDKAEASFKNGILTLTIPKAEEAKPKTIKVKAKDTTEK